MIALMVTSVPCFGGVVGFRSYQCYAPCMPSTEKISVTIGRDELRQAKHLASRLGLSLSSFISEAVRLRIEAQARREAGLEVLATFEPEDRATPEEMEAFLASWDAGTSQQPKRGRRRRIRKAAHPRTPKKRG